MTKNEVRIENIHRCLDATFAHYENEGIDLKTVDRLELHRVMSSIAKDLAIPDKHFENAYAHQICELNGIASQFLEPITNQKNTKMKKIEPMLPSGLSIINKDEPTITKRKRPRIKPIEPYISPLNFQK